MKTTMSQDRARVIVAFLALYFFWGGTYLAIRFAVESMPPLLMAGVRFLTAGSLMYVFFRIRGVPAPTRAQWGGAFIVGMLLLIAGNGGVVLAEHWGISSGLAALGVAATPLWTSIFALFWGESPNRIEWIGVGIGLLGVGLLNADAGFQASPAGAIAILIGPICWAFGSLWSKHLPLPSGLLSSAAQMLSGGVVFLLLSLLSGERLTELPSLPSLLGLAYLIVLGSIVGYSAFGYVIQRVRPALATSYSYVNPVVAVLLGSTLAGERISTIGLVAMGVIVAGVALVIAGRERSARRAVKEVSPVGKQRVDARGSGD